MKTRALPFFVAFCFVAFYISFLGSPLVGEAQGYAVQTVPANRPLRVAVVGLTHGHVMAFLPQLTKSTDAQLVGVVESDKTLVERYASKYNLPRTLFYADLEQMLSKEHPDAVLVYTSIVEHARVIEAAARHGASSMVEKPLATTMEDALEIRKAAREHHVQVLVNYETTWYSSNAEVLAAVRAGKLGTVRKVVVHDGHEGPKEIGVGPEFLSWLTDPKTNGAGALFDFGCYGADLLTVLENGKAPISVMAEAQTDKPDVYPKADDDATVILRYPGLQAVLMPSWDWSFARKDMEVYGSDGAMTAVDPTQVTARFKGQAKASENTAPALPPDEGSSLGYLTAVLRGQVKAEGDLSSLDTNMVVMQILTAAREAAQTGRTVTLQPLPQ